MGKTVEQRQVEHFERVSNALSDHDVLPEDRAAIQDAYALYPTWEETPKEIQDKIVAAEKLPLQVWNDPADVPDDLG